jgi:DNA polymerase-4
VTAEKMNKFGSHQGKDLQEYSLQFLTKKFGKSGLHFYNIVRGIHMSEVQPNRERKSISAENTFEKDLPTQAEWKDALKGVFEELMRRIEKTGIKGRTITLKIKYKDFTLQTRSKSFDQYPDKEKIWETVLELLNQERLTDAVRLFGIGISNLNLLEEKIHFGKQLWFDFEEEV